MCQKFHRTGVKFVSGHYTSQLVFSFLFFPHSKAASCAVQSIIPLSITCHTDTEQSDGKIQFSIGEFAWTDWTNISFMWSYPRLSSALTATEEGVNNSNCTTLWAGWLLHPRHMAVSAAACLFTLHC